MSLAVLVPAAFGAGWAALLARRAPGGAMSAAGRTVAGGTVAVVAAWIAYLVLERYGMRISWSELAAGGGGSVVAAAAIGLVEETAKLLGLAIASLGAPPGRGVVLRRILGVSAVFASFECAFTLGEGPPSVILIRSAFAPIAHAALSLPLGLALAGGRRGLCWAGPALAAAATLHGASNLALVIPSIGRLGHAAILAAPAVALHLRSRLVWARPGA